MKTKKNSAKKVVKASSPKKPVASERTFLDQSMFIVKKVDDNPRRKGTLGHKSFAKIAPKMTVEQFKQKGGRLKDLRWDLEHDYLKLVRKAS